MAIVRFKNIRIRMKNGKTRLQRVKVLKSGKFKFVKNLTKGKTSSKRKGAAKKVSRRTTSRVSVRRGGRKTTRKLNIPLAVVGGLAGAPDLRLAVTQALSGQGQNAMKSLARVIGIQSDGKFNSGLLLANVGSITLGLLIHKFIGGKLGLNRMLGQSGIPFVRL